MILRLFKSGRPSQLFFIPLFALILWLKYFILPQPVELSFEPNPMPFYRAVSGMLENYPIPRKIISLALLIITSLWVSRLSTKFILYQQRTYLPALLYILIVSSYLPLQGMNPAIFAGFFLVWSIELLFSTYKKGGLAMEYFLASFLIAVASLFYARAAILMFIVWIALILFRSMKWREWLFTILGFMIPCIFLFSWYYLAGQDMAENWEKIKYNFVHDRATGMPGLYYSVFYSYLILLILLASLNMLKANQKLKINIRKFFRLNFWLFAIMLTFFLVIFSRAVEMIYVIAVPVSHILGFYLLNIRSKLIGNILITLLLAGYALLLVFH